MRQGSKVKALVEAGVGHTTGHGAAWGQQGVLISVFELVY